MTKDDIISMARKTWVLPDAHIPNVLEFANLVAAAEREACAKLCDGWTHADGDQCAEAIRARGQHGN